MLGILSTLQVAMLKGDDGIQVITNLSHDASTGLVTLPAQLSLQTLQGQGIPSFTIGGDHGQQVLVVTDPSQLEMLQVGTGYSPGFPGQRRMLVVALSPVPASLIFYVNTFAGFLRK